MRSYLAFSGTLVLATVAILLVPNFASAVPFLNDNLVIRNAFDGDYSNSASGAVSAGTDGDAFPVGGELSFVSGQAGFGNALRFGYGFNHLEWDDEDTGIAPFTDVAGPTGMTFSMLFVHGETPYGTPAWLFNAHAKDNADQNLGDIGARINTTVDSYRMTSPGGFFGHGDAAQEMPFDHLAYTVVPEFGQFRAKFYLNGVLNEQSGLFSQIDKVSGGIIGGWHRGGEWRLNDALIDEFRLYNVSMNAAQIAILAAEIGDGGNVPPATTIANWVTTSGNWMSGNWDSAAPPDSNEMTARFGSEITAKATVYLNADPTVKRIEFDNPNTYAISGPGSLTLDADTGSASIEVFADGPNDQHEIEVDLVLADDSLDITAASTTTLDINEPIALNGQALNILGAGTVNLNSGTTGGGSVTNSGTLGTAGSSSIGGSLNSTGTIDIDINGAGNLVQYDSLIVSGNATLGGTLDIDLADGLATPDSITVLTAGNITNNGITLGGPDGNLFTIDPAALASGNLTLVTGGGGLAGDFNGDGTVNAADYTVWQDGLGGAYTVADYGIWKGNFGATSATGSSIAVPEPAALLLCCGLVGVVLGIRQTRVK
jgi:hypothetical protein